MTFKRYRQRKSVYSNGNEREIEILKIFKINYLTGD
jgi:hypothetical protein